MFHSVERKRKVLRSEGKIFRIVAPRFLKGQGITIIGQF